MEPHIFDLDVPGPKRDYVGYGSRLPKVEWPNGASIAVSIVVNYEEGSEFSIPMGDGRNDVLTEVNTALPGEYRDLGAESMFEYGSRAGVWRIMRLFQEYGVKSTFYAAAVALEKNPEVAAAIVSGGHEPCSHGWRWDEAWKHDRDAERERLQWTIDSFVRTTGRRCVGCYHRYAPSVNTRELLVEEGGFLYDSDTYNDDLPYFVDVNGSRHLVVPYSLVYNDSRYTVAQGHGSVSAYVELCTRAFGELRREAEAGYPKMISLGLHPRLTGQPGRVSGLRQVIENLLEAGDCWIATREEIAQWWIDHHEEWPVA